MSHQHFPCALVVFRAICTMYCYTKSSVCPSVTLRYRRHVSWVTSKVITRIISLRPSSPNVGYLVKEEHPKIRVEYRVGVAVLSRRHAKKRNKIGPRLQLMTNRKSHKRFRLVPKSTTLDDLKRPLRILFTTAPFVVCLLTYLLTYLPSRY